jgi:hypothetical protein
MRFVCQRLLPSVVAATALVAGPLASANAVDAGVARPTYYDRLLVASDLEGRSLDDLSLMRNTIYARAGRRFKDPKLREYFSRQPWYRAGSASKLSSVDVANVHLIAERERALLSQHLTFPCPEARADGSVVDPRAQLALLALAHTLKWNDDYGFPDCHRRVLLQCGPDIDGDGQQEAIVRIEGYVLLNGKSCKRISDSNDYWPVAKTFFASGRPGGWRNAQMLGADIVGDQQVQTTGAGFVRRRDGRVAIEFSTYSFDGGNGCGGTNRVIYRPERGKLRIVENIPDTAPCDEQ